MLLAYLLLIPYYCADCKVVALLRWSLLLCVQVSSRLQLQENCHWAAALQVRKALSGGRQSGMYLTVAAHASKNDQTCYDSAASMPLQ